MSIFLVGLIAINILYVFTGVLFHPMQSTDAIGIWLLKAKAFYVYGGFPLDFLRNSNYNYSHQQYPLGIPFIFYLFYLFIGGINEKIILLIYPFTYVAILFVAYKVLKSITDDFKALIFTYFYSMFSPLIAQGGRILAGGADIFITLIGWLIAYFILVSKSKNKYFIITALIIVASQIKAEAFFLSIILLFMPLKAKKKISFFIISLIPFLIWRYLIFLLKIPSNDAFYWRSLPVLISRFFEIIQGVFREFINYKNWYMF
ncbi:MAG: hypothetical protein M1450_04420, partial [Patescibacteria group bacterium]|nr:hypothetical protein [Patescibacteria group bacterium]